MTAVRSMFVGLSVLAAAAATAAQTKPAPQPAPAPAQTATEQATAAVVADTDQDLTNPRAMRLTLDQALTTSMERNLGIQVQRYNYLEAGQVLVGQYGLFDWLATADIEQDRRVSPPISRFQASGSRSTIADFGVSQVIPTGGSYSVTFNNSRVSTTGGGTVVNPAYSSSLGVSVTQPLFRNF